MTLSVLTYYVMDECEWNIFEHNVLKGEHNDAHPICGDHIREAPPADEEDGPKSKVKVTLSRNQREKGMRPGQQQKHDQQTDARRIMRTHKHTKVW